MKKRIEGWYVIYTKPRHEKKVAAELSDINIASYLPSTRKVRVWNDRKKIVEEPLFPSYVFTYVNDLENFYKGIAVEGALYYVRMGKEVAKVSESVINNIRLITSTNNEIEVNAGYFKHGQQFVIQDGGLEGLSCEVVEYKNEKRILVRVNLLQQNILVSLSPECLLLPSQVL